MSKRLARVCSPRLIFSIWFARNESGAETENFQKVKEGF